MQIGNTKWTDQYLFIYLGIYEHLLLLDIHAVLLLHIYVTKVYTLYMCNNNNKENKVITLNMGTQEELEGGK